MNMWVTLSSLRWKNFSCISRCISFWYFFDSFLFLFIDGREEFEVMGRFGALHKIICYKEKKMIKFWDASSRVCPSIRQSTRSSVYRSVFCPNFPRIVTTILRCVLTIYPSFASVGHLNSLGRQKQRKSIYSIPLRQWDLVMPLINLVLSTYLFLVADCVVNERFLVYSSISTLCELNFPI